MEIVTREIDGQSIEFSKAPQSHIEGRECLYVGRLGDAAYLFESENPELVIETTPERLRMFANAIASGELAV